MSNDGLNTSLTEKAPAMSDEDYFDEMVKATESGDRKAINALMNAESVDKAPIVEPETPEVPETPPVEGEKPVIPEEVTPTGAGDEPIAPASGDPTLPVKTETPAQTPEELLTAANARIQAVETELHRFKSDAGRVPGLQKRMAELEKRLTTPKGGDSDPGSSKAALSDKQKAALADLRENDPVLADGVEKALLAGNDELRQELAERQREADEAEYARLQEEHGQAEYQRLVSMVPQAPAVFQSSDWKNWKASLKPSDRVVAESNNADEVYQALMWFKSDLERYYATNPNARPAQAPTQAAPSVAPVTQATPATPVPQVAPKTKGGSLAAQPNAKDLTEAQMYAQVWKEVGDREGYKA